jgi:hypothetical protein
MKSQIVDPSSVLQPKKKRIKILSRPTIHNGHNGRLTITNRATMKGKTDFSASSKMAMLNYVTPGTPKTDDGAGTPIFLRQRPIDDREPSPELYNRQEVYEAILRGEQLDSKRIWKEQTIQYSPGGVKTLVPLTSELRERLSKMNAGKIDIA